MLHIWQICAYAIFCVIDMFFLSVYVSADTCTANEVKKQRKTNIMNTLTWYAFIENPQKKIKMCIFNERVPVQVSVKTYMEKKHVYDAKYGICVNLSNM